MDGLQVLLAERDEARSKALESLARYKFQMFGYWAAIWVHANRMVAKAGGKAQGNPFGFLVGQAREELRVEAVVKARAVGAEPASTPQV